MPTQRYKIILAYRGTRYHGWQRQPATPNWKGDAPEEGCGIPTIQENVARALGMVVGHPVHVVGSSRTDAGVHAKGQVAHFDTDKTQIPPDRIRLAANHRLPKDIVIREIQPVPDAFHAIKCTICKRYQYFIWNARDRNPFLCELSWLRWQTLNVEAIRAAAAHLVGEHDFASFCQPGHGRETTVRTIHDLQVSYRAPKIVIGVEGSGFLWNMVRIIVGTLVQVGLGNYTPDDIPKMLAACKRTASGPTAPAHGLFLQWIKSRERVEVEDPPPAAEE